MRLKPDQKKQNKQFSIKRFQEKMNTLIPVIKKNQNYYTGFKYYKSGSFISQKIINKIQKSGIFKKRKKIKNKKRIPIPSRNSVETYRSTLEVVESFLRENNLGTLMFLTINIAEYYLLTKSVEYAPPTLKKHRQALQFVLRAYGRLDLDRTLTTYPTKYLSDDAPRAYSYHEVCAICEHMSERNVISVWIAYYAGLRAHEFLDIQRGDERKSDDRVANDQKFWGMEPGEPYTVKGKGGLVRDVMLPLWLVEKIEGRRKTSFKRKMDRKIPYNPRYDVGGGASLSSAFSRASKKALGFSRGFHGLRHSYAQRRFMTLLEMTSDVNLTLETVAQEIGHFREAVTKIYLRGLDLSDGLSV